MRSVDDILRSPCCLAPAEDLGSPDFRCTSCGQRYPTVRGHLDFLNDATASTYDEQYFEQRRFDDLDPYLKALFSATLARVGPAPLRVLDAGAGLGIYSKYFDSQGHQVYSVDASPAAARLAGSIRADVRHLPFASGSFDIVLSAHVLEHLTDGEVQQFLSEAARVMRERARLIVLMPNGASFMRRFLGGKWFPDPTHINVQATARFVATLRRAGFYDVRWMTWIDPLLQYKKASKPWLAPYFGLGDRLRKVLWVQDLIFWALSSTPLARFRDVMFVSAARPRKSGVSCKEDQHG